MSKERRKGALHVFTDGEEITIRIGVDTMSKVLNDSTPAVIDQGEFSRSMVSALVDEQEDGTTLVHIMLDAATDWCLDQGMDGFDYQDVEDD